MVPGVELTRRGLLEFAGTAVAGRLSWRRCSRSIPVHVGYAKGRGREVAASLAAATVADHAFDVVTLRVEPRAIARLRRRADVRYVEPVRPVRSLATREGDESSPIDGGIDRIDADVAHENGETGAGAHVGVVDSGIEKGHDALGETLAGGTAFVEPGFLEFTPWDDDYGHGTHCAGLVSASDPHGVCTDAALHAVRVLDGTGRGTTAHLVAGIEHVADRGRDVATLSVGTAKSKAVADACAYAAEKGVVLVAAAGPEKHGYPARYEECIAVGAVNGAGEVPDFSPTDGSVDLVAPGVSVRSSLPGGYGARSGTSPACACVAGAAALLAAKGYGRDVIRVVLESTAEDIGLPANSQGAGLLDVAVALGYGSTDDGGEEAPGDDGDSGTAPDSATGTATGGDDGGDGSARSAAESAT